MNNLIKIYNNFKANPDIWFFYGFLIAFTLSIRKVLFFYPINGRFNEWTGIYLYLSDVFLISAILIWLLKILCHEYKYLSINILTKVLSKPYFNLPLILVIWSFASILWSDNQNVALFRAIKLLEYYFLFLYIIFNVSRRTFFKNTFYIIIALGFIQAIIGIWQFVIQHSIGLFWLKESLISPDIAGVAKIALNGGKFIRVYGLFPHPNILGGFLLISIILIWAFKKTFRMEHLKVLQGETLLNSILAVQVIALVLTLSKSAIIGLFTAFLYISWKNKKMSHIEHLGKKVIIIAIILTLSLYLAGLNFGGNLNKSISDRVDQWNVSYGTIVNHFWIGLGQSQYVINLTNVSYRTLEDWQYQPIHNVFLLILSELGFVGLFIFVLFLWKLFRVKQNTKCHPERIRQLAEKPKDLIELDSSTTLGITICKGIFLGLIFIMLFDHYLWDIQQGQIMFWIILGFLAGLQLQSQFFQSNSRRFQT